MWVKICGTTNLDDALLAVEAGADAVGFVFAESARRVFTDQVAEIVLRLPQKVEKIGVFTKQNADAIRSAAQTAGLTGVQLHSLYNASLVRELKTQSGGTLRIFQVVALSAEGCPTHEGQFGETVRSIVEDQLVDAILLDTAVAGTSGGTGVAFDWDRAAVALRRVWPSSTRCRLIVAGGLRPENVLVAIGKICPWGVDVVTGVESVKGRKDAALVRAFVNAAKTEADPHIK